MYYRIEALTLPDDAREEFERRAHSAAEVLRGQPGFVERRVYDRVSGDGAADVVTIVTWDSLESIDAAGKAIAEHNAATGFDLAGFRKRHGITGSQGVYAAR